MKSEIIPANQALAYSGIEGFAVPKIVADAGDRARLKFIEFFTATIRNPNTRAAYARAVARFCQWCEARGIGLRDVAPVVVASYVEMLGQTHSKPTVKQSLAAIRMLFDWLVVSQVVPANPASSVRGPAYVQKRGKTPVLSALETRTL